MLQAVTQSEEAYMREQNQARARDEQLRSVRQTDRSSFHYFTPANSTPIRNGNTRPNPPEVHFNTNPTCHAYSATSDGDDQYEPPINDSIIQMAASAPTDQLTRNTTGVTGVTTHGDAIMVWVQPQTQTHTERQLYRPVITVYTTTSRQIRQTIEMAPYASDAENKVT